MVYKPYVKAIALYHRKLSLVHRSRGEIAVAELKVWKVPASSAYPTGVKYSMFLANRETGEILIGFDNHQPKGPHLHVGGKEVPYRYQGVSRLVEDFWKYVRKEGFEL